MNKLTNSILSVAAILAVAPLHGEEVSRAEFDALSGKVRTLEQADVGTGAGNKWYDAIEIALGATGVVQGSSGAGDLIGDGDKTDGSASIDIEITAHATESGAFFVHLESGSGDGLDGDIATLSGFNDDADDDSNLRLTEVWYEQAFGETARLRLGKVDLSTDFDTNAVANDETAQFLSCGFVNAPALEFPDDNGLGAMFWMSPTKLVDIGVGVADANADWDNVFEDPFAIAEVDFKPVFGELQGNYRFYAWYNGKDHEDLSDGSTDAKNHGFGLSFDQQLNDIATVFVRTNIQRGEVSQVASSWSAGLGLSGSVFGRDGDSFGLAYGMALIGDDWKDFDAVNGIESSDEGHLELYYNLAINEHLSLSPDIQWVTNPNGDRACDDVFVFGLRAQVSF
ncbi:MAG TPA: carbohydrate porin [Opitutales bacterium]|mgnify:CR=1 FL=1|nr:carbohydrate porin [Opitutales bacterium]